MPSRRQSSEMFSSPRSPSSTLPPNNAGGSDAECPSALVLPALCPARISVSSSLLAATMNQKSWPSRMQDVSRLVLPIPVHAFFKQAVLQGEIGHDLLQGGGLTAKVLHFAGGCGARRIARQSAFAGLQELLGPAVIHRGGDAFAAAKLGDVFLTAQPFQHDADLLFRRIMPAGLTPNVLQHLFCRRFARPGFLFHLRSLRLR